MSATNADGLSNRIKALESKVAMARARAAAGATGALGPTFVFRPGGIAGGKVYTTWASLMAAVALCPGPKCIEIDSSLATAHMTTGAWNLDACTLQAAEGGQSLIIDNGATISGFTITLDGALFVQNNSAAAVWTTDVAGLYLLIMRGASEITCSAGAGVFLHATATATAVQILQMENTVLGDNVHNVISVDVGVTVFDILFGISSVFMHALAGAGEVQVTLASDSTVDAPQDVATLVLQYSSGAARVNYVPGAAGNWQPDPTLVGPALDQLAAQNFVQALAAVGAAAATQSIVTGNIAKKKTGNVRVSAQQTVATSVAATVTFQLLRDAVAIGPAVQEGVGGAQIVMGHIDWLDALPDAANHTYMIQASTSAGTLTQALNSGSISAQEM